MVSELFTRLERKPGYHPVTTAKFSHIKEFGLLKLLPGQKYEGNTADTEVGLVILEGTCSIAVGKEQWSELGSRKSVFEGLPTAIYIPPDHQYVITATQGVEIALCQAACTQPGQVQVVYPKDVKLNQVGRDNWSRQVRTILGPDSLARHIIVGETLNPPGNWSGTPPHRHEGTAHPGESLQEELYYFRSDKPQGWGVERIYSPQKKVNELIFLQEGVVTFMPWGYHQIVAAPGYTLYYLFFLAGPDTKLTPSEDTDHNWIKGEPK